MNLAFLLSLFKRKKIYQTISKVLATLASFVAGADSDRKGNDDLTAGVLFAVAAGVDAYAEQDNNEYGNIVDGVIACLTEYRRQAVDLGLITGDRIVEDN
jgi:hypothetical protein